MSGPVGPGGEEYDGDDGGEVTTSDMSTQVASGETFKVLGELNEKDASGVLGINNATTGTNAGVRGRIAGATNSLTGAAVVGEGGSNTGILAQTQDGILGLGVRAVNTPADAAFHIATFSEAQGERGIAIEGRASDTSTANVGVYGIADGIARGGDYPIGVQGIPLGTEGGPTVGTRGASRTTVGAGVVGRSGSSEIALDDTTSSGVRGVTDKTTAQSGVSLAAGVQGVAESSGAAYGVIGATSGAGYGVYADGDARVTGLTETASVGTTGATPLLLQTEGTRALRLATPRTDANDNTAGANVIAGSPSNETPTSGVGVTIAGGGYDGVGGRNQVRDNYGTVGGGFGNVAGSTDSNPTNATAATVAGGRGNDARGSRSAVLGGSTNEAAGNFSSIGGGNNNAAGGRYAAVPGGRENSASGDYSVAMGRNANASGYDGAIVAGDSTSTEVTAGAADEVRFQAGGGFVIDTALPAGSADTVGIDSNGQLVNNSASSARYKSEIGPFDRDPGAVLELEPKSFEFDRTGERDVGLVAEEVAEHVPELVTRDAEGRPEGVRYDRLGVHLLPEVRENRRRLERGAWRPDGDAATADAPAESVGDGTGEGDEDLRRRVEELEAELAERDRRIERLEERIAALEDD